MRLPPWGVRKSTRCPVAMSAVQGVFVEHSCAWDTILLQVFFGHLPGLTRAVAGAVVPTCNHDQS